DAHRGDAASRGSPRPGRARRCWRRSQPAPRARPRGRRDALYAAGGARLRAAASGLCLGAAHPLRRAHLHGLPPNGCGGAAPPVGPHLAAGDVRGPAPRPCRPGAGSL
ncbi:MAG: hypothetical protein AVDCRST_MAG27-3478, partial [uncultured Craurococcus sp.]